VRRSKAEKAQVLQQRIVCFPEAQSKPGRTYRSCTGEMITPPTCTALFQFTGTPHSLCSRATGRIQATISPIASVAVCESRRLHSSQRDRHSSSVHHPRAIWLCLCLSVWRFVPIRNRFGGDPNYVTSL